MPTLNQIVPWRRTIWGLEKVMPIILIYPAREASALRDRNKEKEIKGSALDI
jgi:hypothetical protein